MSDWNYQARWDEIFHKNNDEDFSSDDWLVYIDQLVKEAHIAGSLSNQGTGLNLSKEERAEEYCREKGLRT